MKILNFYISHNYFKMPILIILIIGLFKTDFYSDERITNIQKIGEIKVIYPSENDMSFFWKISGVCCDREDSLYVADAGWNKIFKFDSSGAYIKSFGREGAGPGEFLGSARGGNLRISSGNDENIYVLDYGSWRLSVFTRTGEFIKQFKLQPYTCDTPAVNSKGDIYLLSHRGIRVVDRYDSNFKFKASLLDFESHYQFPHGKPQDFKSHRRANEREIIKLITKDDELILISNFSLKVFVFDRNNQKINEFAIVEKGFIEDYKRVMQQIEKENKKLEKQRKKEDSGEATSIFVVAFNAFLDWNENICLTYFKSDRTRVIYRYKTDGTFIDTWILPSDSPSIKCANNQEHLFALLEMNTKIGIYSIPPPGN